MTKKAEAMPRPLVIRHFEDEPGKVDLPELIEIGLYHAPGVTDSKIAISDARDRYDITFRKHRQDRHLVYVVEPTIAAMDSALANEGDICHVLDIVDMSIGGVQSAGIGIVRQLIGSGVLPEDIWMLTAYYVEARSQLTDELQNVRCISKPPNHRCLRDEILQRLFARVTAIDTGQ